MERASLQSVYMDSSMFPIKNSSCSSTGPKQTSSRPPRLVILGLDGVCVRLVEHLAATGRFPALREIAALARPMEAHLPELSPVNWSSFFTAAPPGEHGIYGFTDVDPTTGALFFPNARHVRLPTIFARLGEAGYFSKVLNLPALAPVQPCRAVLVAGFPAQDLHQAVWPTPLANILAARGYRIEADTELGLTDTAGLLEDLRATLRSHRESLPLLWDDRAWDLMVVVFTLVDRIGHFLYPALVEETHPWRGPCLLLMEDLDAAIFEVLERFADLPDPKRLVVLADHGFTTLRWQLDLNAWLAHHRLLAYQRAPVGPWDIAAALTPSTAAFALDPGRIYLHTRRRFAQGTLSDAEAACLGRDIAHALRRATHHGHPLVQEVFLGHDLYGPQAVGVVPDLVVLAAPGVELQGKMGSPQIVGPSPRQGVHTAHDALFADTWDEEAHRPQDVGQLVLRHFGLATPPISFM